MLSRHRPIGADSGEEIDPAGQRHITGHDSMFAKSVDSLSFTLREVATREDLASVCELRASCYGRHAPALREIMAEPDAIDLAASTTVFMCIDKASGETIGAMRLVDNTRAGHLEIEEFLELPAWIAGSKRGEMTRLVVSPGADPLVKPALWKAGYLKFLEADIEWLIIGARKPGLIKQYEYLGAKDLYSDGRMVPLGHGWKLPHRIFVFNVASAARDWYEGRHRLLRFMVETEHPDIALRSMQRPAPTGPHLTIAASH